MRMASLWLGIVLAAGPIAFTFAESPQNSKWRQLPAEGVLRDAQSAIIVARGFWISMHPDMRGLISDEAGWLANYTAELKNGVWEVGSKDKNGRIGDGVHIFLAQRDGRYLDTFITE